MKTIDITLQTFDTTSDRLRDNLKDTLLVGACEQAGCYPRNSFKRYSCPKHKLLEGDVDDVIQNVRNHLPKASSLYFELLEATWKHYIAEQIKIILSRETP